MASNPTKLNWSQSNTYTDGSPFGQADFAGFELAVDGQPSVAIPVSWNSAGTYEFQLSSLSLAYGAHTVVMYTVAKNGNKSNASNSLSFTLVDPRVPRAPLAVSAV